MKRWSEFLDLLSAADLELTTLGLRIPDDYESNARTHFNSAAAQVKEALAILTLKKSSRALFVLWDVVFGLHERWTPSGDVCAPKQGSCCTRIDNRRTQE